MVSIELRFRIFYSQWAPTQLTLLLQERVEGKVMGFKSTRCLCNLLIRKKRKDRILYKLDILESYSFAMLKITKILSMSPYEVQGCRSMILSKTTNDIF